VTTRGWVTSSTHVAAGTGASAFPRALSVAARKVRIGRAFKAMEENMQPIKSAFTRAASPAAASSGVSLFWLMVWAIAILDDSERREEERRKKRNRPQPQRKPKRPSGPQPF
jgi:hypothetical protein